MGTPLSSEVVTTQLGVRVRSADDVSSTCLRGWMGEGKQNNPVSGVDRKGGEWRNVLIN